MKHLRKFIAPSLLIAALACLSMTGAQQTGQTQKYAHGTKPPAATKVKKATLPAAMIKTIRTTKGLKEVVTIKGNTITTRPGTSLWSVGNESYVVITDSGNISAQSEVVLKPLPGGAVHFYICMCTFKSGNDSCRFSDGGTDAAHCGGERCCGFHEGEIAADGTLRM